MGLSLSVQQRSSTHTWAILTPTRALGLRGKHVAGTNMAARHAISKRKNFMSISLILLIVLILILVGALPTWGHSRSWGYGPSGGIGLVVLILVVLLLMGKI